MPGETCETLVTPSDPRGGNSLIDSYKTAREEYWARSILCPSGVLLDQLQKVVVFRRGEVVGPVVCDRVYVDGGIRRGSRGLRARVRERKAVLAIGIQSLSPAGPGK